MNPSSVIQYYALHPYVGLGLWDPATRWLAKYDLHALWMIEPWVAYVNDAHGTHKTESFEIGLNALFFRLVYGSAVIRPFSKAAKGRLTPTSGSRIWARGCSSRRPSDSGSSTRSAPAWRVGLRGRFRHMSNAGMASSNPGINTAYGLLGLTFR